MRRSVWIFLASIFLPSLGLAWMAVRSAEDQQVVLEHQQVIISQNITDALAQNIQSQMDQVRADFVSATQQLLSDSPSPQDLAESFNTRLHTAWPLAEIGFAVNLDGEIYSPKPIESPGAKNFRSENGSFLSNRENAEVYSFINGTSNATGLFKNAQTSLAQKKNLVLSADLNGANATAGHAQGAQAPMNVAAPPEMAANERDRQLDYYSDEKITEAAQQLKIAAKDSVTRAAEAATTPSPGAATNELRFADAAAPAPQADLQEAFRQVVPVSGVGQAAQASHATKSTVATAAVAPPPPVATDSMPNALSQNAYAQDSLQSEGRAGTDDGRTVLPALAPLALPQDASTASGSASLQVAGQLSSLAPMPASPAPAPSPAATPIGGALVVEGNSAPAFDSSNQSAPAMFNLQTANTQNAVAKMQRLVIPQKMLNNDTEALSNTVPEESDFRRVIGSEASGSLARFLENKLRLMVWSHPADTSIIFGAQLDQARLVDALKSGWPAPALASSGFSSIGRMAPRPDYCLAVLDDSGQPVALSQDGFKADWKHPFVSTEIGEALPHWEAALYLVDPQQITRTARTLRYTLGLIVLMLVAAIVSGGSLIAADVRRQIILAQQKTDFVSNVSHELKTPLTSIRMFADLLAEKRVPDEQRQSTYLRIISAEAARLTRLINNVLDFARLERGAPPGEHHDCDLVDAVRDVVETCGPHLEAAGVAFRHEIEADALPIRGDRDALAQIILNLVSNAEKYGGSDILVRVRRQETPSGALGCVDVLDRGAGIPAEQVRTIFEPFHRLDDSLASGIPGSGLGLTLARRMARSHGGDVTYAPRGGGGSCFTLGVPIRPV